MDTVLWPIMWVISWILYGIHKALTALGMQAGAGPAWIFAIIGLTIVVRLIVLPLYNKQIKASRQTQILQPEIQKIQAKYKGKKDPQSQQRMAEEMQALYREAGTSPFASCMPMLIQMPVLFALFRVLYAFQPIAEGTYDKGDHIGPIDANVASEFLKSEFFGAPLSASMNNIPAGASAWTVRIVAALLILFLMVTMFYTTKQLTMKNMPESAMDPSNPMFKTQKYMMYGMPLIYLFTGVAFQIGVLVYWCAGNLWNIGQQSWFLRNNPTPGSTAHKARIERLKAKKARKGKLSAKEEAELVDAGEENVVHINDSGELVGKDGLTDEERARKNYERRQAERARSKTKKKKKKKK
ncbi:MAG: membrane protein insertase YidC [Actinomycetaceae bacterium]|nr:membrane protein insertase YidC [Actinomycetaceae bacterium]